MHMMLLLACSSPRTTPSTPEQELAPAVEPVAVEATETDEALLQRIEAMEGRVARLELTVAEILEVGTSKASAVGYDPSRTTLAARNVQDALTELHEELGALKLSSQPAAQPGPGLFQIPDDNKGGPGGQGPGGQGPGGQGPGGAGNGPPGPPPAGKGGAPGAPPGGR